MQSLLRGGRAEPTPPLKCVAVFGASGAAPRSRQVQSLGSGFVVDAAGIVITNNESLGGQAKLFMDAALPRDDGPYAGRPYANYRLAPNYKINDLMGAVLNAQLERVDGYIKNKNRFAIKVLCSIDVS